MAADNVRVFHASDLHFGRPAVPAQIEAIETAIQEEKFDVVAISGDLSQRARSGEFQRASAFLRDAGRVSQTIVVPGNHDVRWWHAPLGLGDRGKIYATYREFVSSELEPALYVPGAAFVGLNTSHGITRRTLTWNLRDLSIIGDLKKKQFEYARTAFSRAKKTDARVIVMHHNPVKGELSQRHGLKGTKRILGQFAEMDVDLILCGHDHQESVHFIEHTRKGTVIATAGTVSSRSRGGRPSSVNVIDIRPTEIEVHTRVWSRDAKNFVPGPHRCFKR